MCDAKIQAPQVQHFLNARGIQPATFSPLAPKIIKEEVFSPGEIKVILPPPDINALKGDDQKPKSLNFPFKKPDTLNMEFIKKYDFFDPAQRSLADKELKELAKLEANTEKLRKDMAMMNQVAFMNTKREEAAKEKLSQIEAWEESNYPGNPLNATQQALGNAEEQAGLQRLYLKKVEEDSKKEKEMEATVAAGLRELEAETQARNTQRLINNINMYDDFTGGEMVRPREVLADSGRGIPNRYQRPSAGLHGVGIMSEEKRRKLDVMMIRNRPATKEEKLRNVFAGLKQNVMEKKQERADDEEYNKKVKEMFNRKKPRVAPQ